ncbi:hypothetical protein DBR32_03885 [Taibaiella sp. KBW10]|uniref:T9SS type A sorting domain-containing protein n=1 Tax=Taibaiella sp. KBW10 TaxID=2153357 RepID=UPI000F59D598|nr:T9SS type A sorting domain-containing protein [Taibaiella sp. KBW10]RQO31954.1 hypothetical protein DBR32_03885 [Taibaiella sp. KBW10]
MKQRNFLSGLKKSLILSGLMALTMGLAEEAQAQTTISGTVFRDDNRNTVINAGENFAGLPVQLYIYLVNPSNLIIDSAYVAANGTYTVDAVNSSGFTLHLSTLQYAISTNITSTPIDHTAPTGYVTTGENISNSGFGDANPNGIIQGNVGTTPLANRNFGIACKRAGSSETFDLCANDTSILPLSAYQSLPADAGGAWTYQSGSGFTLNAAAGTAQLTSTAVNSVFRYDIVGTGGCANSSSTQTFVIRPIPVNTRSLSICAGDSVCIVHPDMGAKTINASEKVCYTSSGTYSDTLIGASQYACDSIVVTTLTVTPCGSLEISGSLFNDGNSNTIINAGENFTTLPAPLYVYLVNSNNIIVDSSRVAANGSYILQASSNQTYTVKLSTQQYPLGTKVQTTPINTTPPAGWSTTGENGNNNAGSGDGTPDGSLTVVMGTSSVNNKNFGIATSTPLPVNLLYFKAAKVNTSVQLNWSTISERSNKGFNIERSNDGNSWSPIGFVNTKAENGNSNANLDYNFMDKDVEVGKSFYRLKQLDQNGNFHYSSVVLITLDKEHSVSVYPNPASDELVVAGLAESAVINIINTLGQELYTRTVTPNEPQVRMNISALSNGVYYIVVIHKNKKVITRQMFIKQ